MSNETYAIAVALMNTPREIPLEEMIMDEAITLAMLKGCNYEPGFDEAVEEIADEIREEMNLACA